MEGWTTPISAQGSLLAVHSEITLVGLRGPFGMQEVEFGLALCSITMAPALVFLNVYILNAYI